MSRWTEQEDKALRNAAADGLNYREAAKVVGRSESGCAGRASKLKITFEGFKNAGLRQHLGAGGSIVRDEIGGVVGIGWADATRSGESFNAKLCERLRDVGLLKPTDRPNVFRATPEQVGRRDLQVSA